MCPADVGIADGDERAEKGSLLASISAEMVRLYKEQFGRGPTKVRSNWSGRDMIVVLMEDTLTAAERNLAAMGEYGRLRDTRMLFQYAWVAQFCEPVERLTGRKVRSFISGIDAEADGTSLEVFLLHPDGYDGPSRAEFGARA
ncbi:MAG TPA: DUF2294 domain-containing protein [Baekduia sp.]|nr:DUF2294 domain-containing protein [Baekduia sp.]